MGLNSSAPQQRYDPAPAPNTLMGQLYSQDQPQALSSYHLNSPYQNQHHPPPMSTTTQAVPLKVDESINKSSIKLIPLDGCSNSYKVEFEFSSDYPCTISIYFFAEERQSHNSINYVVDTSKYPQPEFYNFKPGNSQKFDKTCIDLAKYSPNELFYRQSYAYPLIIELTPIYPDQTKPPQSLTTYLSFERKGRVLNLVPVRQKLAYNGQLLELMEIYGFAENQGNSEKPTCIICLTEKNNTTIMPCRHVCLCQYCAELLKNQGRNLCPICRGPIESFVTINKTINDP